MFMGTKKKDSVIFALVLAFCVQIAAAQTVIEQDKNDGTSVSIKKEPDPRETTKIFPARKGRVNLGLALSGGGIRSAVFSIGVMKALYDLNILDDVDVISSASGGGYASYWLFNQYLNFPNDNFGHNTFNNENYIRNVCYLQNVKKSSFLSNWDLLNIIKRKKSRAFEDYRDAINESFGNANSLNMRLDAFKNSNINNPLMPYFIINTTVQLKDKELDLSKLKLSKDKESRVIEKRLHSVYEITPDFRGNAKIGFTDWSQEDIFKFSDSVALSGAPKWKLERPIKNPNQEIIKSPVLRVSDGGHSENLAALALIRRGIENVIIIDAEQDPKYEFVAYRKLKEVLQEIGIKLDIHDIEEFKASNKSNCYEYQLKEKKKKICSPKAVNIGSAVKEGENAFSSKIYYIKMSQPESVYSEMFLDSEAYAKGEELVGKREKQRCLDNNCKCENILKDLITEKQGYDRLYTYRVKKYNDYLNYSSKGRSSFKVALLNTVGRIFPFFIYKFPHTTTVDQSFFSDQLEAFVGLGYLQTMKSENVLKIN